MKSHPLGLVARYELFEKGKLVDSHENRMPESTTEVQLTIKNPGQPTQVLRFPFRSYMANFCRVLNNAFLAVDDSTGGTANDKLIKAITGGATYAAAAIHTMAVNEGALSSPTQSAYGIWIGDPDNQSGLGLTPEANIGGNPNYNDYMLRCLLPADGGSPDTNITYLATNVTLSNADATLTVSRRFQNTSATVDMKIGEIGLVGKSGTDYFLIARDKVGVNTPIPANQGGGQGEQTYTPYYTLAAGGTCEVDYIFALPANSGWTKNYNRMLSSLFNASNALSQVIDYTNAAQTINFSTARTQMDLLAAVNIDTYGILVTSGGYDNIYTLDMTYLYNNKTAKGTGINNLNYSAVTPIALTTTNNITQFGLYRDFEYLYTTGSNLVSASGLVIRQGVSPYTYYLICWDAFAINPFTIKPNQVLRVSYLFQAPLS